MWKLALPADVKVARSGDVTVGGKVAFRVFKNRAGWNASRAGGVFATADRKDDVLFSACKACGIGATWTKA